jgi:hypothetical protein
MGAERISFSLGYLDTLSQTEFETTTIWTDGVVTFSGVALSDVLQAAGARGETLELVALNDYKVAIPFSDIEPTAPIVATRMNNETMPVRDKGPFWVVYPYDANTNFKSEVIYARSVWQLNRINILD